MHREWVDEYRMDRSKQRVELARVQWARDSKGRLQIPHFAEDPVSLDRLLGFAILAVAIAIFFLSW